MANEEAKTVRVFNNDAGPRFINAGHGQVVIQSGGYEDVPLTSAEVKAVEAARIADADDVPMFTVEGADGDDDDTALDKLPIAQLRKLAEAEDVPLTGRKDPASGNDLPDLKSAKDIAAAIEAKRAETAPPAGQ